MAVLAIFFSSVFFLLILYNMKTKIIILICWNIALILCSCSHYSPVRLVSEQPVYPVLTMKAHNPVLKLQLLNSGKEDYTLSKVCCSLEGTSQLEQIDSITLFFAGDKKSFSTKKQFGETAPAAKTVVFAGNFPVDADTLVLWVSVKLKNTIDLTGRVNVSCTEIRTDKGKVDIGKTTRHEGLRIGVAVRKHRDDNVHTYRIPGLATSRKGTLLAVYDVRRDKGGDLQGNIDIGLSRSVDGGNTWAPMQIVMDRGTWGGLPEKFNGISDACILVDENTDAIFIAGLWMHGVLDKHGKWIKGLNESSEEWNHQWRNRGSQAGFGVKETSQFLITKSVDDGQTWSEPENLTSMCKQREWWLWAPAPGRGITMSYGTLVMPTQGRDKNGKSFSTVTWSKDGGVTWVTGIPAFEAPTGTTECAVVELSNGSLMLNMRDNRNRNDTTATNGRAVAVTADLGRTWTTHSSSHHALIEPTCMGSLHKHTYTENGKKRSVLLFSNPNSKTSRHHLTIKVSFDDGETWPQAHQICLDEGRSRGYSCLTSVDEQHIGILYESSQADLVFQKIPLKDILQ
jgi:sialidase-1